MAPAPALPLIHPSATPAAPAALAALAALALPAQVARAEVMAQARVDMAEAVARGAGRPGRFLLPDLA